MKLNPIVYKLPIEDQQNVFNHIAHGCGTGVINESTFLLSDGKTKLSANEVEQFYSRAPSLITPTLELIRNAIETYMKDRRFSFSGNGPFSNELTSICKINPLSQEQVEIVSDIILKCTECGDDASNVFGRPEIYSTAITNFFQNESLTASAFHSIASNLLSRLKQYNEIYEEKGDDEHKAGSEYVYKVIELMKASIQKDKISNENLQSIYTSLVNDFNFTPEILGLPVSLHLNETTAFNVGIDFHSNPVVSHIKSDLLPESATISDALKAFKLEADFNLTYIPALAECLEAGKLGLLDVNETLLSCVDVICEATAVKNAMAFEFANNLDCLPVETNPHLMEHCASLIASLVRYGNPKPNIVADVARMLINNECSSLSEKHVSRAIDIILASKYLPADFMIECISRGIYSYRFSTVDVYDLTMTPEKYLNLMDVVEDKLECLHEDLKYSSNQAYSADELPIVSLKQLLMRCTVHASQVKVFPDLLAGRDVEIGLLAQTLRLGLTFDLLSEQDITLLSTGRMRDIYQSGGRRLAETINASDPKLHELITGLLLNEKLQTHSEPSSTFSKNRPGL